MQVTRTFDIIDWNIEKYSREVAIAGKAGNEWKTYSTGDYRENTNMVSYGLRAIGLRQGDKVATITGNRPEWCFVDMGLSQAGMVHVPVYPTIGPEEYQYILSHAEVKVIFISNRSIYKKVEPVLAELKSITDIYSFDNIEGVKNFGELLELGKNNEEKYRDEVLRTKESITPDDLMTIIYTSGTTGQPKGVMLSHKNIVSNILALNNIHHLGFGNRAMSFLPLCHIYERTVNYHFQYKGMSIYYIENMGLITELIKEVKPHVMNTVPRLMEKIYDGIMNKGQALSGIKKQLFFWAVRLGLKFELKGKSAFYRAKLALANKIIFSKWREALGGEIEIIVSGGAAIQPRLERIFWAAGLPIIAGYGLTETSPVIAVNPFRTNDIMFGTVGPPLPGVEVKIAEDGEILTRGPHVMMGYYKNEERTREMIDSEGWVHTGDIGTLVDDKWLKITDRKKEIFKTSAGKYIAPQVIENKLKESVFVEQAMVIGENQKFASALISPNFKQLHNWCAEENISFRDNSELVRNADVVKRLAHEVERLNISLGDHEKIKRFRLVEEEWSPDTGELSPTLKLRRNELMSKYEETIEGIFNQKKN
ncbi:MAG TPA: long-chain fatty acid--CoA ligase [Bacteroidetes bacterium]|nr:long-chain fatty acid--CoA ligase [Bacteroidota bacterium]